MNSRLALQLVSLLALSVLSTIHSSNVFNVLQFGAVGDNKTDSTEAFMKAWSYTCEFKGKSALLVPARGTFYLRSVVFKGPCNGPKDFVINGVLRAPNTPDLFFIDHWISFQYINRLRIYGGGTLDGQGASAWPYNKCNKGSCNPLPVSLRLDFVNDSEITRMNSINSKNFHINIFASYRLNLTWLNITAPHNSPNTDGIHIGDSGDIRIDSTDIATGDDCISILTGSRGINISNVHCGPGHGISIGSLGQSSTKEGVSGVSVEHSTFRGTLNGVQIKTWPDSRAAGGFVSNVVYDHIQMVDVDNPIFLNQHYCPNNFCDPNKGSSTIDIRNITFSNIWGTSTTKEAVKLDCSSTHPCRDIVLDNINITGPEGISSASCNNTHGISRGKQKPPSCLTGAPIN